MQEYQKDSICLFCGKQLQSFWDEYDNYFKCTCKDWKKTEEINKQIEQLRYQLPEYKYTVITQKVAKRISK